jgi:HEAT repeat protein
LENLGPRASAALPALLEIVRNKQCSAHVHAAAAAAVGSISGRRPAPEAVDALAHLLKDDNSYVRSTAVRSLLSFGPHAWSALPGLPDDLAAPTTDSWGRWGDTAVAWLARFDPPPVEAMAAILADRRSEYSTRLAAAQQLGARRSQARSAVPALRRVLREPTEDWGYGRGQLQLEAADALLAIDPDGAPALVLPVLSELLNGNLHDRLHPARLLGQCGAAARPAALDLLKSLNPDDYYDTPWTLGALIPLLGPGDEDVVPTLRRIQQGKRPKSIEIAKALFQLGRRGEAMEQAAKSLDDHWDWDTAARWLGEHGKEAEDAEPALRKAMEGASGAKKARFALTLAQVRGEEGSGTRARALAALRDLLALCEGQSPSIGAIDQDSFWDWDNRYAARQENAAVGAAVGTVYSQLVTHGDLLAVLAMALADHDPHVRLAAAVALARAEPGHKDIVPTLRRALERYPHFFAFAADTLAALGPTAASLAPHVLALTRHPDDEVARAAARVLRRIDPALAANAWGAGGVPGAVPDDPRPLWDDLAGDDALRADLAVWRLAGAGPRAVALVRERLRPPPAVASEHVKRLIADLDNDDFDTRERASAELANLVEAAAPALRRALAAGPSAEQRYRLDALLADHKPTPEERQRQRAVRILEGTGAADAKALLKSLACDEEFGLTVQAADALRYLDGR